MAEVITFRPTADAQEILARVKSEGGNISKFLNNLILSKGNGRNVSWLFSYFPEDNNAKLQQMGRDNILMYTAPIGTLSARRYKEFVGVLKREGMDYFYFRIDDDHTIGIVAANREEASIQFAQYYTYDRQTKEYDRTSIPLPQVRYHIASRTVVIITSELI